MTVYAKEPCVVQHAGGNVTVRQGDAYDNDHPLVQEYLWLFDGAVKRRRVERATAAPGELRDI